METKQCKVVMLSTKKASYIDLFKEDNSLLFISNCVKTLNNQHLYIISDDEIKEGDWGIHNGYVILYREINQFWRNIKKDFKKIIATTDGSLTIKHHPQGTQMYLLPQPSQLFIEKYIESYNAGKVIVDILVEYGQFNTIFYPKTNKDNTINIKKIKNSWNREEVIKLIESIPLEVISNEYKLFKWIKDKL